MEGERTDTEEVRRFGSQLNFTVDSFNNGIAFGKHKLDESKDPRDYYTLRVRDNSELVKLRSRYALHKKDPFQELELQLMKISKRGILGASTMYFGVTTDPFLPFEGKFDASMKFLNLFQKYTPGLLMVQTRSPLVVLAIPVLKRLGKRAAVTIGIETCDDYFARRYTPEFPRVAERIKAARTLRTLGVEVTIQVAPVLPYGDWKGEASKFAEMIIDAADYITVRPASDGTERMERRVRGSWLAKKLAADRKFQYLRPDSAVPLINAIENLAPEKLKTPDRSSLFDKQLKIFAA